MDIATPGAAALSRALRPLARPVPERRWDAVVVVDEHPSMLIWQERVSTFVAQLRRQDAFRRVWVRRLHPGAALGGTDRGGGPRRRIVFVVTDGTAAAWHSGAAMPELYRWACRRPVVIIHLLPQWQWHRTGVRALQMRLRAPVTGAANARLHWRPRDGPPVVPAPAAVPIPVLELRS